MYHPPFLISCARGEHKGAKLTTVLYSTSPQHSLLFLSTRPKELFFFEVGGEGEEREFENRSSWILQRVQS